jgi:hypothetical protein
MGFLRDIKDPRFAAATKVELGMLTSLMIAGLGKDPHWLMLTWYEVQTMPAQIMENSPAYAIEETDLAGVPARTSVNTLNQRRPMHDYQYEDRGDRRPPSSAVKHRRRHEESSLNKYKPLQGARVRINEM